MHSINKNSVLFAILGLLIFVFSSCSPDPIFASIEKEIKLKDPSLRGSITSLVIVGSDLYASNGYLYKRSNGVGNWNSVSNNISGRCANLATDGTSLYALYTSTDHKDGKVYQYDGNWNPVSGLGDVVYLSSGNGRVFAFAGSDSSYTAYTITGTNATALSGTYSEPVGNTVASGTSYFATISGVYDQSGSLLTGAPTSDIRGICSYNSNLYVLTTASVYQYDGTSTWTNVAHSVSKPTSIAFLDAGNSKRFVLISGSFGYGEVSIETNGELVSFQTPGTSSNSSIPQDSYSQFSGSVKKWTVTRIFAISKDQLATQDPYVLYASVANTGYDGLWSFYPSEGNWNRE